MLPTTHLTAGLRDRVRTGTSPAPPRLPPPLPQGDVTEVCEVDCRKFEQTDASLDCRLARQGPYWDVAGAGAAAVAAAAAACCACSVATPCWCLVSRCCAAATCRLACRMAFVYRKTERRDCFLLLRKPALHRSHPSLSLRQETRAPPSKRSVSTACWCLVSRCCAAATCRLACRQETA